VAYKIAIDWSSAEVVAEKGSLELRVRLTEEPDTTWRNAFEMFRNDVRTKAGSAAYRFHVNSPSPRSKLLTVGGFEAGAVDEVRRALDEAVEKTNVKAALDAVAAGEREMSDREDTERLERDAKDATSRFRSGS
jgi:hypothetical protein